MRSCLAAALLVLASGSAASAKVCAEEIVAVGRLAADRQTAQRSAVAAWHQRLQSTLGTGSPYFCAQSQNQGRSLTCEWLRTNIVCEARTVPCAAASYPACGRAHVGENATGHDFCSDPGSSTSTPDDWSSSAGYRMAVCEEGYVLHTAPNAGDLCVLDSRWR